MRIQNFQRVEVAPLSVVIQIYKNITEAEIYVRGSVCLFAGCQVSSIKSGLKFAVPGL